LHNSGHLDDLPEPSREKTAALAAAAATVTATWLVATPVAVSAAITVFPPGIIPIMVAGAVGRSLQYHLQWK